MSSIFFKPPTYQQPSQRDIKGSQFHSTLVTDKTKIRHQLLEDFEQFARRKHLQYIFHSQNKKPHPFYVKSN